MASKKTTKKSEKSAPKKAAKKKAAKKKAAKKKAAAKTAKKSAGKKATAKKATAKKATAKKKPVAKKKPAAKTAKKDSGKKDSGKKATAKSAAKPKAKAPAKRKRRMTEAEQTAYIRQIKSIVRKRGGPLTGFRVLETVVEPSIGVCHIEGIRSQIIDGKKEDYYIFNSGTAKVYVPMSQIETRGVRRPMTRDEVKKIYQQLKVPVIPVRGDARQQYLEYREIMKSGEPGKISKLLRELFMLDKMDELKGKEKEIMEQAKKFLVDEISFIRDEPKTKILEDIQECLEGMYRKKVERDKIARAKRQAAASAEQ